MQKEIVRWIKTISDEALDATANGLATWQGQNDSFTGVVHDGFFHGDEMKGKFNVTYADGS